MLQTLIELMAITAVYGQMFLVFFKYHKDFSLFQNNRFVATLMTLMLLAMIATLVGIFSIPLIGRIGYQFAGQSIYILMLLFMILGQYLVWPILWKFKSKKYETIE
jgi:uncharacterized membrane protein